MRSHSNEPLPLYKREHNTAKALTIAIEIHQSLSCRATSDKQTLFHARFSHSLSQREQQYNLEELIIITPECITRALDTGHPTATEIEYSTDCSYQYR